jgi:predicted GH43/DUF377 family glycosyl hydrolase
MNPAGTESRVFDTRELLPEAWRTLGREEPVRSFNPGLLRDGDGWIFAYRIVLPDGRRRIGICRLDRALNVVPGSQLALTDLVRFRPAGAYPEIVTQWFADPRLYRFGGRVFVYWNSGWHEPRNWQFLQALDPRTLEPHGPPRELVLRGPRQKLEKNWTFFEEPASRRLLALYSITPHRILEFSLAGDGDVVFEEAARIDWTLEGYPPNHGGLRGGAPPCWADGRFWVFCHSVHDGAEGYRYAPAVYCFAAEPPFAPIARPKGPLEFANRFGPRRTYERLNPAVGEVVYPCGAVRDGARWLISHGINDEHSGIALLAADEVAAAVEPVRAGAIQTERSRSSTERA